MQIHIKIGVLGPLAFGLAACGGSSGDPTRPVVTGIPFPAAAFVEGTTPVSYDPATNAIDVAGVPLNDPRIETRATNGTGAIFLSRAPLHFSAVAQNSDVYAVVVSTDGLAAETTGGVYARLGTTTLPPGTASFQGDYVGLIYRGPGAVGHDVSSLLTGTAALNADFDAATVSGSITDREVLFANGDPNALLSSADVGISAGTIATDGTFSATATGGAFASTLPNQNWTSNDGTVAGLFGGATGGAAAGVVRIEHDLANAASSYDEIGSFVAD